MQSLLRLSICLGKLLEIHRINDLSVLAEDATKTACQYPLTIFPEWLRIFLLTVLPMGFVSYVPSLYIIRGQLGGWVIGATLLLATVVLMLAYRFWLFGISKTTSKI